MIMEQIPVSRLKRELDKVIHAIRATKQKKRGSGSDEAF